MDADPHAERPSISFYRFTLLCLDGRQVTRGQSNQAILQQDS